MVVALVVWETFRWRFFYVRLDTVLWKKFYYSVFWRHVGTLFCIVCLFVWMDACLSAFLHVCLQTVTFPVQGAVLFIFIMYMPLVKDFQATATFSALLPWLWPSNVRRRHRTMLIHKHLLLLCWELNVRMSIKTAKLLKGWK